MTIHAKCWRGGILGAMSRAQSFVHLHTHSHYSLLEALPKIHELIATAKADGQQALALTDTGNLYAAIDFYKEAKKQGVKPIIGVDLAVAPHTRHDKEHGKDDRASRVVLLAKNETGYKNLLALVSRAHLEGFHHQARADRELLEQYKGGLVAILPAYHGEAATDVRDGQREKARESYAWYRSLFGDDVYQEITRHPESPSHESAMRALAVFARECGVPLLAAHESYYLQPDDALARELVNKIRTGSTLSREFGGAGTFDLSFISQERALELFADMPEALDNTQKVADMCNLELTLGAWVFPDFPIPAGSTHDEELRKKTYAGIAKRGMEETPALRERIEYELGVICGKGYSPYFLVVADLLKHAREANIYTNTRGSAAGSLVSYLCGITTVDPISFNMPFERFLNPERPSPPDIDMDIADNRRDDMIDYARAKYGEEKVAQIGTFGTMLARAAVRDVARALGHSYGVGDRIAKLIPFPKQGFPVFIKGALEDVPELKALYESDADAREILDLAQRIEGNARHMGVHAAGVVISPSLVTDYVPVQNDPKGGKTVTQYDMHAVEEAGLLKYDFLGLKNLSVLADAVARVEKRLGVKVDLDTVPLDDENVYAMLTRGETLGVFQFASSGMTSYLKELRPTSIHDLNAMVALYRPGPMAFIPEYIKRKRNPAFVKYLDPRMEPILKPTYGILIYQDDLLMITVQLAGYSWGQADKFRKAVGKKIPEEMAKQKVPFIEGCIKHGMKESVVHTLWEQIETFAAYGFNKAHAVSYGGLAYKTAYMKANFSVDYMAAVLTADAGDVEKISDIVAECTRMGISVLPPDVNASFGNFTVTEHLTPSNFGGPSQPDGARVSAAPAGADTTSEVAGRQISTIRFGLYSIKNFGTGVADEIITAREKGGAFSSITDFCTRVDSKNLNKKAFEALIKSGALDSLGERGELLANIDTLLQYRKESGAQSGTASLFGTLSAAPTSAMRLTPAPPAGQDERLAWEKELLGLYVSGHPLDKHREKLSAQKVSIRATVANLKGVETVIAGFIENLQTILTKNGERMAFMRLADLSGSVEAVAFPRTLKEFGTMLTPGQCVMLKGRISERKGEPSFVIDKVKLL